MNEQREPGTAIEWGSFQPQVLRETDDYRLIVWPQSASRHLSWTEPKDSP